MHYPRWRLKRIPTRITIYNGQSLARAIALVSTFGHCFVQTQCSRSFPSKCRFEGKKCREGCKVQVAVASTVVPVVSLSAVCLSVRAYYAHAPCSHPSFFSLGSFVVVILLALVLTRRASISLINRDIHVSCIPLLGALSFLKVRNRCSVRHFVILFLLGPFHRDPLRKRSSLWCYRGQPHLACSTAPLSSFFPFSFSFSVLKCLLLSYLAHLCGHLI